MKSLLTMDEVCRVGRVVAAISSLTQKLCVVVCFRLFVWYVQDRRRVAIDIHLKRFDKCVGNMAEILKRHPVPDIPAEPVSLTDVPDDHPSLFRQCLDLVDREGLYTVALQAFRDAPEYRHVLLPSNQRAPRRCIV